MEDPTEELEPLFDYSRVQPVIYLEDDDLDLSPVFLDRKRKRTSDPVEEKKKVGRDDLVVLDDEGGDGKKKDGKGGDGKKKEEEDWMPPPPKIPNVHPRLTEDKTLRELRLQKLELASFAQSAQDVLISVIESAKREYNISRKPASEAKEDKPSEPQVERRKVVISIQDKNGQKSFCMYSDDNFERLFKMYAEKAQLKPENLVFCFDGDKVSPTATPEGLGLENGDMIEVHVKSQLAR